MTVCKHVPHLFITSLVKKWFINSQPIYAHEYTCI
jgi:hypothetical protein